MANMDEQLITNNIKPKNKNLEKLKKDFPHCFDKNGHFDIEKFKQIISQDNDVDFYKESYGMDWLGKSYARLLATDAATTLLKEDEEWNSKKENKNAGHLLIKGDNLEVLKHLSNAYYEKIKMIYIDPPYNTGSDGFVYQDDRKFTVEQLAELAGIDEEKAKRILDFVNSKSNTHSAWLTFMYPRLYIAKHLLREDGVIFVSIDDNEVAQLRILMDEIFGEENVEIMVWDKIVNQSNAGSGKMKITHRFRKDHEYVLVGYKNKEKTLFNKPKKIFEYKNNYGNKDNDKRGDWLDTELCKSEEKSIKGGKNYYSITLPSGKIITRQWHISKEEFEKLDKDKRIYWGNGNSIPRKKVFLNEPRPSTPTSVLREQGGTSEGIDEVKKLFSFEIFENPKNTKLLTYLLKISTSKNDLILDFFAGSGTTGDAVMQLNAEDGGNRKYILIQLPESIDPKKNKTAYDFVKNELGVENPTIFEITKERLIRAAKKIKEETINKKIKEKEEEIKNLKEELDLENNQEKIKELENEIENLQNQDLGFKIFETMPIWEDYEFEAEEFDKELKLFDESKLTADDIRTLLTTWKTFDGIPLTESLKEIDLDGYTGYYYDSKLYLMDKGFKTKNLKKLLEAIDANKEFNPASIIAFGYHFESKVLREIAENVKHYTNKKQIDIDFIVRH